MCFWKLFFLIPGSCFINFWRELKINKEEKYYFYLYLYFSKLSGTFQIRIFSCGSGSGRPLGIRRDPDPKHCCIISKKFVLLKCIIKFWFFSSGWGCTGGQGWFRGDHWGCPPCARSCRGGDHWDHRGWKRWDRQCCSSCDEGI